VPAKPLPLRPIEPAKRPTDIPDGLWSFPRNLADEANARGWSQADVAKHAGVTQPTISRWMRYEIEGLKVADVLRIERAMGLPHGELTIAAATIRSRGRDSGLAVETHDSLPPEAVERVLALADELRRKALGKPRRGARPKRDHA
jgi:transcriptional regulator with XRE-family HTH domain